MKISKVHAAAHQKALDLVYSDRHLNYEDRLFVLENYHEGATHMNALAGAFFTPLALARDLAINVSGGSTRKVVDLCAGTGRLGFAIDWEGRDTDLTCIEWNEEYVAVGRRVLPHARWIQADVLSVEPETIGRCDFAVSNPPFGRIACATQWQGRYRGADMEYRVIEAASALATWGAFILPQGSCPFHYSGQPRYHTVANPKYDKFRAQTGIELDVGVAVDTSAYRNEWRGASPLCEIVVCDFPEFMPAPGMARTKATEPGSGERQLELI